MRHFLLALAAGAAAYGGAISLDGDEKANAGVPNSPAVPAGETYRASAAGSGVACTISKLAIMDGPVSRLRVDRSCEALLPGLAAAKYWRDNEDGSVSIGAHPAGELIAFAVADGAAYESYRPARPLITLLAQE